MNSYGNRYALAIEEAKADVAKAMTEHSKGGSVDKVNAANSALAKAHCRYTEWTSGRVPDDRY